MRRIISMGLTCSMILSTAISNPMYVKAEEAPQNQAVQYALNLEKNLDENINKIEGDTINVNSNKNKGNTINVNSNKSEGDTTNSNSNSVEEYYQKVKEIKVDEHGTFIPFRSSYVRYLSYHASEKSEVVKSIWKRLFYEELQYTPIADSAGGVDGAGANSEAGGADGAGANSQATGIAGDIAAGTSAKWSDKYYDDYLCIGGEIKSSKGMVAYLDPEFSGYLVLTLRHNPEFLEELLSDESHGFHDIVANYLKKAPSSYPYIEEYFLDVTKDGTFIGTGMDDPDNMMKKYQVDYDLLHIFANRWDELNQLQIDWALSYMSEIYADYVKHHDDGLSMAENAVCKKKVGDEEIEYRPLYDLMARSEVGAKSNLYQQEFFDYVVGTPENINDLPHGLGDWLSKAFDISDDEIRTIDSIYDIFTDEAHCIPGCDKCGEPASYANALAYYVTFSNDKYYKKIRELITKNKIAYQAMIDWKDHYEYIHNRDGDILFTQYNIGWSDRDSDYHGWHGQGYHTSASASVSGNIYLADKLTSNSTKITLSVQGGSSGATLYTAGGKKLISSSASGSDSSTSSRQTLTLNLAGFTADELQNAYVYASVSSHDSATVNNSTCNGALANANVYSIKVHRKIATCYEHEPAHHNYLCQYVWNDDFSKCVAYATCSEDRSHTTIAYSQSISHTEDEENDYYTPVFLEASGVDSKTKVVPKNTIVGSSKSLNLNDSQVVSGKIYQKDESEKVVFHGEGVSASSHAGVSFSILKGAIPENTNNLTFNVRAGYVSIVLYLDGEPISENSLGNMDDEADRSISIDLSRYSSKQISRMYAAGYMESHNKTRWAYGLEHRSTSTVQLKSVVAKY